MKTFPFNWLSIVVQSSSRIHFGFKLQSVAFWIENHTINKSNWHDYVWNISNWLTENANFISSDTFSSLGCFDWMTKYRLGFTLPFSSGIAEITGNLGLQIRTERISQRKWFLSGEVIAWYDLRFWLFGSDWKILQISITKNLMDSKRWRCYKLTTRIKIIK